MTYATLTYCLRSKSSTHCQTLKFKKLKFILQGSRTTPMFDECKTIQNNFQLWKHIFILIKKISNDRILINNNYMSPKL